MRHWLISVLLGLLPWLPLAAKADSVILIHGYHASAATWEQNGVAGVLAAHGWPRGGLYTTAGPGVRLLPAAGVTAADRSYLVDLPSEAPVRIQADRLQAALADVAARHPGEPITLVGHSAGGVVARLVVVEGSVPEVSALVTIAAPNLGTERTIQALRAADIPWPFSYIADFFGGEAYDTVRRSGHLLIDLLPAAPGTLLGWLNNRPHPPIRYVAIVRGTPTALTGDWIVPGISQDLNSVAALQRRAYVITVPSDHFLTPADGYALLPVLNAGR